MSHGRTKPAFRPLTISVFVKCAMLVAVCTAVVATVLTVKSSALVNRLADESIARKASMVTKLVAERSGGEIRFGKSDAIVSGFRELVTKSDGQAVTGLAIGTDGGIVADLGEGGAELRSTLTDLARRAVETGEPVHSLDGMLTAYPAHFGSDQAIVGAVAIAWSEEVVMGPVRAATRDALVISALVFLAALAAGVVFLRQSISIPLRKVGSAMEKVATGDYDVEVPALTRGDEIGAIARDLEGFRGKLADAAEATRASIFRGAGFEASSAAMLMTDENFNITLANPAFLALVTQNGQAFRELFPDFEPKSLVGKNIDIFHRNADKNRRMVLSEGALPMSTDIRIGPMVFSLGVNEVRDGDGARVGYVMEWADVTGIRRDTAVLQALEAKQITLEFDDGWRFARGNDNLATLLGKSVDGLRGTAFDRLVTFANGTLEAARSQLARGVAVTGRFEVAIDGDGHKLLDGSLCPIVDAKGRSIGYLLLGLDITEQERQLASAEETRKRMEAAQKQVVEALRTGLAKLSEGDLTHSIDVAFGENYEGLRTDFNATVRGLHEAIVDVLDMTVAMRGEVTEITGAADDLSRRTEHQAATLEETAASLAEITAAVTSAAEGARLANEVVAEARSNAENSGKVVSDAVSAMGEISASSERISKIIGVIDDIAFQTNLLALNAGVEAARAGDAGRGFAVVASEVRALAQRSSEAAREINELITTSSRHVRQGVDLVGQAGEALKKISASVTGISDHVSEIVVSAQEQSTGLTEINSAMGQLDQVTQQNAAMFEETTAASHALARQTEALSSRMSRFRVRSKAGADRPAAARPDHGRPPVAAVPTKPTRAAPPATDGALALRQSDPDDWEDF